MNLTFADSAFDHGLSENDIRQAMNTCFKSVPTISKSGKQAYMGIGIIDGRTCELMFNVSYFNGYRVFHAMCPARKSFASEIEEIEKKG